MCTSIRLMAVPNTDTSDRYADVTAALSHRVRTFPGPKTVFVRVDFKARKVPLCSANQPPIQARGSLPKGFFVCIKRAMGRG